MNSLIEQSITDPRQFLDSLNGLSREELSELYRKLDGRVQSWGDCLNDDHHNSLNTLIRSRDETGLKLIAAGHMQGRP